MHQLLRCIGTVIHGATANEVATIPVLSSRERGTYATGRDMMSPERTDSRAG